MGHVELFNHLERVITGELSHGNTELMEEIILRAVVVKARIVAMDEREGGIRRLLNLGHTLGHAIEKCTREVNHGEAVAIGMSQIAHASVRCGMLAEEDAQRIDTLLERLGFSLTLPINMVDVLREVKHDKKKCNNVLKVVLPIKIGECIVREMTFDEFERLLK